jgi:hypothetical protein
VGANKCGVELGCVAYCGKSQIVSADGSMLSLASQDAEETLVASVQVGAPAPARATGFRPAAQQASHPAQAPLRIALASREFQDEAFMEERLRIIEASLLVMPESTYPAAGSDEVPLLFVTDDVVLDPGGLAAYRLRGVDLVVWKTGVEPPWQTAFARARALELRMYVITMDNSGRAFAVDPDGAVVCGTFGGYEIAGFTYDPARAQQTMVAPGTDVRAGLERAREHAQR